MKKLLFLLLQTLIIINCHASVSTSMDVTDDIFHFTAQTDNVTIGMTTSESAPVVSIEYCTSTDNIWRDFIVGTTSVTINNGEKMYIKAKNPNNGLGACVGYFYYNNGFTVSDNATVSGNIMYLLDPTGEKTELNSDNAFAFYQLFLYCSAITDASQLELPATTLAEGCYQNMFWGCSGITVAPALPAMTVADWCYVNMFKYCTGLTTAPELPATTLGDGCYSNMFWGCSSLTTAPELPATTLKKYCYQYMFNECSSLVTPPALPATTLTEWCYCGMFDHCTAMTETPELPATTLTNNCYKYMFNGCNSLTTAHDLPALVATEGCYAYMFWGCSSLESAPALPATTLGNWCYHRMFGNCTNLTEAPELPATTLTDKCYYEMFRGCTSLTTAPELPAPEMANECYSGMFYGCYSLKSVTTYATTWISYYSWDWLKNVSDNGDFYNYGGADIPAGPDGIPYNWEEHFFDNVDETESITLCLHPNPANKNATIFMPATYDKIEVFSTTGAKVAEYNDTESIEKINVSGAYIVRATLNGKVSSQRLIVK